MRYYSTSFSFGLLTTISIIVLPSSLKVNAFQSSLPHNVLLYLYPSEAKYVRTVVTLHEKKDGYGNDNRKITTSKSISTSRSSFPAVISENPSRSISFSIRMALCGAALGPFLDSFHSAFGVLQYDEPITAALWGTSSNPALITAWWVPVLFAVAGWLIGWLYILLDAFLTNTDTDDQTKTSSQTQLLLQPTTPKILLGISIFTFQYWLSGVLVATDTVDRTGILNIMSVYAAVSFLLLDGSLAGLITSTATAIGGPLIEVGLLSLSRMNLMPGGYHYNDLGETGFFPLWIIPVYFLGGPAVGNLARGFWNALSTYNIEEEETSRQIKTPGCKVCKDTRCVSCPNCDGTGEYVAMGGRNVKCTSCSGRGFVICRACFADYDEDPNDIESIRELMSRMPD